MLPFARACPLYNNLISSAEVLRETSTAYDFFEREDCVTIVHKLDIVKLRNANSSKIKTNYELYAVNESAA